MAIAEPLLDEEAARPQAELKPPYPVKLVYSLGQTIESGYLVVSSFVFFYYTAVLGLSGTAVGIALGLSMCLDAVIDPLIGSISDNVRSRLGRRLPLMLLGAPLTGLALWMLFAPPVGLPPVILFLWLMASKIGLRGFASVFNLPYAALGAEMATGYVERASITAYRAVVGSIAPLLITAAALNVYLAGQNGLQVRAHYPAFGMGIGLAMFLAGALATAGVWSYARRLPQPQSAGAALLAGLRSGLPEVFRNRSFRSLFLCTVLFWIAVGVNGTLNNHAYVFVWKLQPQQMQFVGYAYYLGILGGIPLTRIMLAALEKKTVLLSGLGLLAASLTILHLLRAAGLFMPEGAAAVNPLMVSAAVGGVGVALLAVTAPAMMADAADEHELLFGARREGLYFAGLGFAAKAASGVGQMAAGFAIDALHFPKSASLAAGAMIPEHTLRLLILAWGPLAAGFALVGGLLLLPYALTRARHAEIAAELRG